MIHDVHFLLILHLVFVVLFMAVTMGVVLSAFTHFPPICTNLYVKSTQRATHGSYNRTG